jgi:hypothetical protein
MMITRRFTYTVLCALIAVLTSQGCALLDKHPDTTPPANRTPLPSQPPAPHNIDFAQSADSVRLTVLQQTPAPPPVMSGPKAASGQQEQRQLRASAEQEPRVRDELGERFVRLHRQNIRTGKVLCPGITRATDRVLEVSQGGPIIKLTYYSYTKNSTVVVCLQGGNVASVGYRLGYQPGEGDDRDDPDEGSVEFQQADKLARQDSRLLNKVGDLKTHVLLMEPAWGIIRNDPGYGHRVFWVTFSKPKSGDPEFWAIVDLTAQKVLDAGKEAQP